MSVRVSQLPLGQQAGGNENRKAYGWWGAAVQGKHARKVFQQSENYNFTPDNGWQSSTTYHGPLDVLAVFAKKQIKKFKEKDYRVAVDISALGNGWGNMTLRRPWAKGDEKEYDDEDTIQWSLTGNDMEKDILTHPTLKDLTVDADWDKLRELKSDQTADFPDENSVQTETWKIMELLRKGVQTYSVSQYVLRRSSVLMSEQSTTTQITDIGKQFTKTQLETHESLPTELKFALPSDGIWIKRTPSVALDSTRYKVDGEFWHADSASTVLYPAKVDE